jgi:tRNA G18 (ribose-2'-O)-methylase SpoU
MRKLSYPEIFATRPTLDELRGKKRFPMYALVEDIRSLHNVGSIFRTSDAVRLGELYLAGYTPRPPRKEIDKTALGATNSVPWQHQRDSVQMAREIKQAGIKLVALEHTSNSIPYHEFNYPFPVCLVLGNEVEGVSPELIAEVDAAVEIPQFGLKQSLNVSVAYGVVIYHILTQYLQNSVSGKIA